MNPRTCISAHIISVISVISCKLEEVCHPWFNSLKWSPRPVPCVPETWRRNWGRQVRIAQSNDFWTFWDLNVLNFTSTYNTWHHMTSHDHGRPLDDRGTLASHPWPTGHPAQSVPLDSFDTMLKFNVEKKVRTFWKDRLVANANFEREQYFSNGIHFQDPEGIQYGWSDQICWRGFSQNIKYSHTRYDISLKCLQVGLWNLLGQVRILTGDMRHETFETTRVRWYSPPIQSHINRCDIHYLYIWFDDFIWLYEYFFSERKEESIRSDVKLK